MYLLFYPSGTYCAGPFPNKPFSFSEETNEDSTATRNPFQSAELSVVTCAQNAATNEYVEQNGRDTSRSNKLALPSDFGIIGLANIHNEHGATF